MMGGMESLYEFIDDGRADGVDEVDGELQEEDDEQERRHDFSLLESAKSRQTIIMLLTYEDEPDGNVSTLNPSPIKTAKSTPHHLPSFLTHATTSPCYSKRCLRPAPRPSPPFAPFRSRNRDPTLHLPASNPARVPRPRRPQIPPHTPPPPSPHDLLQPPFLSRHVGFIPRGPAGNGDTTPLRPQPPHSGQLQEAAPPALHLLLPRTDRE